MSPQDTANMTPAQSAGWAQGYQAGFYDGTQAREQGNPLVPTQGKTPEQAGVGVPPFIDENFQTDTTAQAEYRAAFPEGWLAGYMEGLGNKEWETVGGNQVMPINLERTGESGGTSQGVKTKSSATPWILGGLAVAAAIGIGYALTRED